MSSRDGKSGIFAIRAMSGEDLGAFVAANLVTLGEDEAIAVLSNAFCPASVCVAIAGNSRLASYYEVKQRLVTCRATPQHLALKFVRHLYWIDLVRHSTDVQVLPPIRRAIDSQLLSALAKRALGERISTAKCCSRDVGMALMVDPDVRVFTALLNNPRLREDDLVAFVQSDRASAEHLRLVAGHTKWGFRYAIRRAIAFSAAAPRAVAASQLRFLRRNDRDGLYRHPATSVYLRRCIEALDRNLPRRPEVNAEDESGSDGIGYNDGANE
ncbi:MAG: hypothetical protein ACSLFQ_00225 [Thermoanaerobaculia bacterium]